MCPNSVDFSMYAMHTLRVRPVYTQCARYQYAVHSLRTRYSFSKIWTKVWRTMTHISNFIARLLRPACMHPVWPGLNRRTDMDYKSDLVAAFSGQSAAGCCNADYCVARRCPSKPYLIIGNKSIVLCDRLTVSVSVLFSCVLVFVCPCPSVVISRLLSVCPSVCLSGWLLCNAV